ncbi:MAG: hypothetical protein ACI4UF_03995, partial [Thermoguttaceae bacterium]
MSVPQNSMKRREFLKTAALTGTMVSAPSVMAGKVLGLDGNTAPSEKIIFGTIGVRSRGWGDLQCFLKHENIQYVANCDIRRDQRERNMELAKQLYGDNSFKTY